jgi:hypothetical protein
MNGLATEPKAIDAETYNWLAQEMTFYCECAEIGWSLLTYQDLSAWRDTPAGPGEPELQKCRSCGSGPVRTKWAIERRESRIKEKI